MALRCQVDWEDQEPQTRLWQGPQKNEQIFRREVMCLAKVKKGEVKQQMHLGSSNVMETHYPDTPTASPPSW